MPHFYHQSHAAPPPLFHMPPPTAMPPLTPPTVQPKFAFEPYSHSPVGVAKEPLEHLRYLAERYKSSSGLSEPLNLSVRAPKREATSGLASSFAPPPSVKNPKFLNKPSPLYSPPVHKVAKSERCEAPGDGDGDAEDASGSTRQSAFSPLPGERPSATKTSELAAHLRERRADSPQARGPTFNPLLTAGVPRENHNGEMEIEIPLSVFQKWLQLCKFPEQRRPPDCQREQCSPPGGRVDSEVPHHNMTLSANHPVAEDLSTRRPASSPHHRLNPFSSYKLTPSLRVPPHSPSSLDGTHPINRHRDIPLPHAAAAAVRFPDGWGAREQRTSSSDRSRVQQSREAGRSYGEDSCQRRERGDTSPPAVLFLNSSGSAPLLQLTSDEVIKLKKIISSSS